MRKFYATVFIFFTVFGLFSFSNISAQNIRIDISFEKTPSFYSGDTGEFTLVFENTSRNLLKNVTIYVREYEYFELSKNTFNYSEMKPGEKRKETVRYTVKPVSVGNYVLKVSTNYTYRVTCSGATCSYSSARFVIDLPFRVEGSRSPIIDLRVRSFEIDEVPYTLPIFIINRGSTVKSSYMLLEYDKSKFAIDYTENIGSITSLVKKDVVITKLPEKTGEYTLHLNLEINDIMGETTYIKFPIQINVNEVKDVTTNTSLVDSEMDILNSEVFNEEAPSISNDQKSAFKILQEVLIVLALFGLIATVSLILLSRR